MAFYDHKVKCLAELEALSRAGTIDLYYGDQTGVSTEGYCPYGWQGKTERIGIAALPISRQRLNCMGWISRANRFYYAVSREAINSDFVFEQLEQFSWQVGKPTFLVLDNARIHKTPRIREQREVWRKRGLHLFYLPPYSPHLNIAETLWRMLKGHWLKPADYLSVDQLFYATIQQLDGVGNTNRINFAPFAIN